MRFVLSGAAVLAACGSGRKTPEISDDTAVLFNDVRLFDGRAVTEITDVLVSRGQITALGPDLKAPRGATVIDGRGKTLLPGLIDAHVHLHPDSLEEAMAFGVTTVLDMMTIPEAVAAAKQREASGAAGSAADLRSAGYAATAPGGHGTEYGIEIPTVTDATDVQRWVDDRIAEGSDYIKIVMEHGHALAHPQPSLERPMVEKLVTAAHARGKKAVVHIGSRREALDALAAGADGLAHLFVDEPPGDEVCAALVEHHAFVVPTLTVLESACGKAGAAALADDELLTPYLSLKQRSNLRTSMPPGLMPRCDLGHARATIKACAALGVPVLAGTDAPNAGTAHGISLHRELELLVEAGLTPQQALTGATAAAATAFGLADRGTIAPGQRADLVLVDGDPTRDIRASRAVAGVWKRGVAVPREAARAAARGFDEAYRAAIAAGVISDFEDGQVASQFGLGFNVITDQMAGGKSTASLRVVDGGAERSAHALRIEGRVEAEPDRPAFASVSFTPGLGLGGTMPVDLSGKQGVSLWARGDGGHYGLCVFRASAGFTPACHQFTAGNTWTHHQVRWTELGITANDVTAITIGATEVSPRRRVRTFWLEVDALHLL